jgi:hypothetical protein
MTSVTKNESVCEASYKVIYNIVHRSDTHTIAKILIVPHVEVPLLNATVCRTEEMSCNIESDLSRFIK